jgi:hypothetical protein
MACSATAGFVTFQLEQKFGEIPTNVVDWLTLSIHIQEAVFDSLLIN